MIRPQVTETTAFGAADAAGLATGFWSGQDELRDLIDPGALEQVEADLQRTS